jgi:2-(1,2-epoxy-1,2-dihydrophenyl)acetyl-CoA isomerase
VSAVLFSRVLADAEVLDFTRKKAADAARGATASFLASKRMIADLREARVGLWASVAAENLAQGELSATEDYREGFAAFQQKRTPTFRGR